MKSDQEFLSTLMVGGVLGFAVGVAIALALVIVER